MSIVQSLIAQAAAVVRGLALLSALCLASPAQAADIYTRPRIWGGTIIHFDGMIVWGDEKKFAQIASRYPAGTIVEPDGLGGVVGPALEIGELIWKGGFDTMLMQADTCASDAAKDRLEFEMSRRVCAGELALDQARAEIAEDWVDAFEKYVDPRGCSGGK